MNGDTWVALDASFKQYEYSAPTLGIATLTYENQAFLESLGTEQIWDQRSQSPEYGVAITAFFNALEELVDSKNAGDDVDDLFGRKTLITQNHPVLSAGLPYKMVATTNSFAQIPDNLRHKLKYTLEDISGTSVAIVYEASLPAIAGKDLSIGFKPATAPDKETLTALLPTSQTATIQDLPKNIPAYLIKLSAQFNVDGSPVVSSGSYTLGADVKHQVSLYSPNQGWQSRDRISAAGEYRAIGLNLQGVDEWEVNAIAGGLEGVWDAVRDDASTPVSQLAFVEKLLHLGIKQYHGTYDRVNAIHSKYSNIVQYRLPSFGYFHTTLNTRYAFGVPRSVSSTGVTMDIPRLNSIAVAKDNNRNTWVKYNKQSGLVASALENAVPEELFFTGDVKPEGVSAVKALDIALAQGQKVYVLNSSNNALIYNVAIDNNARQQILDAINAGKEVTVHEAPISINGWTGSGYLIIDPQTGAGAYLISGGANGGYLGIEEATWLEMLSLGVDFIPGVGSVKAIVELLTGRDLITGEPINRFLTSIAVAASFVGGAAAAKGILSAYGTKVIREVGKPETPVIKFITVDKSARYLGDTGEASVNLSKGLTIPVSRTLTQFRINGNLRYADGVKLDASGEFSLMWEVKNVKDLKPYLPQLRDYVDYIAQMKRDKNINIKFELYIRGPAFDVPTKIDDPGVVKFLGDNGIVPKLLDDLM